MSLRGALARKIFTWDALRLDGDWENAFGPVRAQYEAKADAMLAALRTELAAHPESIEELGLSVTHPAALLVIAPDETEGR